ncbi:MAG: hypothetical protein E6K96_02760 [Thaumarchaeota archaeon]|nr:MAG: hypothetical protein E6K96_02760 [Nitrososphaerota archaeon]
MRCRATLSPSTNSPGVRSADDGGEGHLQGDHAVQFLLAGASAVQVGTAASGNYGLFREIVEGIRGCIRRKGSRRVGEITGFAHRG